MAAGDIYKGIVLRLVLPGRQRVQDRCPARRRPLPGPPDAGAAVARRGELVLRAEQVPGPPRAAVQRQPLVLRARALPQRGAGLAARRACATSRSAAPARNWGIPFPGDPDHRIYVWFDALTNYITGAGFPDDLDVLRQLVAGRRAHHRQEHHALPLPVLAGDADERRRCRCRSRSSPTASCSTRAQR